MGNSRGMTVGDSAAMMDVEDGHFWIPTFVGMTTGGLSYFPQLAAGVLK